MADIETGKIENDKEKNIIDEMTEDRSKSEDATFQVQVTAAEIKKSDHEPEFVEECTNENPCSVLSNSEENKDGKESEMELVQTQSNSETNQLCTASESSTEIKDIREGQPHNPETVDKSELTDTEKSEETSSKTEQQSTEITDKDNMLNTEIKDETEGTKMDKIEEPNAETTDKPEGPNTEMTDKPEGPNTEITDKASVVHTEITQVECSDEIARKSNQNIVGINEMIPQSEVTAEEQKQIKKDKALPDQNPCSGETSETKSNEEIKTSEVEMMDQSEIGHQTSDATVMLCESEISKLPGSDSIQDRPDNDKETADYPPTENGNMPSHLVTETLKMSSSDSSLDSKKENFDDTSYPNEMDSKSAIISSDTIQLPMELDDESIQSAMFDTPGPATPASSIVDTGSVSAGPTPSKRSRQNSTGSGANVEAASEELENHTFPASKVFEYQWPKDSSGEYYMLQEQISEFLGVKSFKRKYPELQRRPVEMNERMFLREKGAVTETQCDLGLTAIRSDEVYDLMHRDYPDKYAEYAAVLHERERQTIKEKHKDYEVPKLEKSKMTEYIQKAMKSASEWNTSFLRERKEERRAYFDLQTFNVHYPAGRFKVLPTDLTSPSPYPVTLIPGQYQDYYKSHSPEELKYLPLNTALYNPPKQLGNSLANPQEVLSEDASEEDAEGGGGSDSESDDDSSSGESDDSSEQDSGQVVSDVVVKGGKAEEDLMCRMCEKQGETDEDMVQCSECKKFGHPTCLDLTAEMVTVIKTYPWQCMECKTCVECMDPYDEDKMIFCDRCDRGYHTFCVGLRSIPNGQWKCRSCKTPDTPRTPKSSSKLRGRGRKRGNNTPAKDG